MAVTAVILAEAVTIISQIPDDQPCDIFNLLILKGYEFMALLA